MSFPSLRGGFGFHAVRFSLLHRVAVCWILLYGLWLSCLTAGVRHANSDDVALDQTTQERTIWQLSRSDAVTEGRFSLPISYALEAAFFSIPSARGLAAARVLLMLGVAGVVGLLGGDLTGSRSYALLVGVLALIWLQIPLAFYGILSSPNISIGLILGTAAARPLLGSREGGFGQAAGVGLAAFLACCMNECFFLPLAIATGFRLFRARVNRRVPAAALAGLVGYIFIYGLFRYRWPSGYSGTQFAFHPWEIMRAMAVNLAATAPGFELLFARNGFGGGHLWRSPSGVAHIVGALTGPAVSLLIFGLVLVGLLFNKCLHEDGEMRYPKAVWLVAAMAVAYLVPSSLTQKYQTWSHLRQYPYFYGMCSWYLLVGLAPMAALAAVRRLDRSRPSVAPALKLVLVVGLVLSGFAVWASNEHVVTVLDHSTNFIDPGAGG